MERRWMEYSKEEKLKFTNKNAEDCTFLVGMKGEEESKSIRAFKKILSSVSPVFERMFNGDFKEAKSSDAIVIDDAYYESFRQFLAFVQNENNLINKWTDVYAIGKKYMADEIVERLISILSTRYTPYDCLCLFDILCSEGREINEAWWINPIVTLANVPLTRTTIIEKAVATPIISCLQSKYFLRFVKMLATKKTAILVFKAVNNYCAKDSNFDSLAEKSGFVALCLNEINFNTMSIRDFLDFVEPSDLMDMSAKHKILLDICSKF